MVTLTASQARIPTDCFNKVVYQGETVQVQRGQGGGPCVYIVSSRDWEILERVKQLHEESVDAAGDRAFTQYDELLRRLAD
ncbi:MAG: hypothetical protein IH984_12745 [Planctomycetes bacterium]|nr:hypothetical protein [Planctomycetota bacterium]